MCHAWQHVISKDSCSPFLGEFSFNFVLLFVLFLLDITQALGWTVAFCVLEKITKRSSDSRHEQKFIGGKKELRVVVACEALRG